MATSTTTVHICGAGPSGALAALALGQKQLRVDLFDPQSSTQLLSRSRAYAITHSSRRLLDQMGLWQDLSAALIPFDRLDLRDQACRSSVLFETRDLDPASRRHDAIGWILDHKPLMALLLERLEMNPNVGLHLGEPAPEPNPTSLVVAADGPNSPTRQLWGLPTFQHQYSQGCLTAKVVLRGVPKGQAYELFRPEGPLAVLPLDGERYQVVWSAPLDRCRERAELPASAFLDQLASVLPEGVEPDLLLDQPAAIPQQLMLARSLSLGRGVLLGEAGHRCHPVGGQGLNLCWRDVCALEALARQNHDAAQIARRYGRQRLLDVLLVSVATDLLVRLFSNQQILLLPLRWCGLKLMATSRRLRRISLRAMTDGPLLLLRPQPD